MRSFLLAAALGLLCSVAVAGPNAGGTIFVHNPSMPYLGGRNYSACGLELPPSDCQSANTEITGSNNALRVWKVYAAFAPCSSPRLKAMDFGVRYGSSVIVVDHGNCCGDPFTFPEQPGPGWPGSGTADAIVFGHTQTTTLVEAYWFAGYSYNGTPAMFTLTPGFYGGDFADDGYADYGGYPVLDPIAGYGSLGFNQPGSVTCPPTAAEGACCVGEVCTLACAGQCGGTWLGPGVACKPDPCFATPVRDESWGRIKQGYR